MLKIILIELWLRTVTVYALVFCQSTRLHTQYLSYLCAVLYYDNYI